MSRRERYGAAQRFFCEVVMNYDGEDCLPWPFARDTKGYALMRDPTAGHRLRNVHRRLCEEKHGPPPSPDHEAAHTCGRGLHGCVNRNHLVWATRKENHQHKAQHGTLQAGEKHPHAKISETQALEILSLKGHEPAHAVAARFPIGKSTIYDIWAGRSWPHLRRAA